MSTTQVRLSAEELKILPKELEALLWVRECLVSDTMPAWMRFDMNSWGTLEAKSPLSCGTACCIGGSMEVYLSGLTMKEPTHIVTVEERVKTESSLWNLHNGERPYSRAFEHLFFLYTDREIDSTTREGAIQAIDNFLAGNSYNPWGDRPAEIND